MDNIINAWEDSVATIKSKLNKYSEQAKIECRFFSPTIDCENFIKKKGFIRTVELLSDPESPLSYFLKDNEIKIDIGNNILYWRGQPRQIQQYDPSGLYNKLHTANGQREMFLFTKKSILEYQYKSNVECFPEILVNIENFINNETKLCYKWYEKIQYSCIYSTQVPVSVLTDLRGDIASVEMVEALIEGISAGRAEFMSGIDNSCKIPYNSLAVLHKGERHKS